MTVDTPHQSAILLNVWQMVAVRATHSTPRWPGLGTQPGTGKILYFGVHPGMLDDLRAVWVMVGRSCASPRSRAGHMQILLLFLYHVMASITYEYSGQRSSQCVTTIKAEDGMRISLSSPLNSGAPSVIRVSPCSPQGGTPRVLLRASPTGVIIYKCVDGSVGVTRGHAIDIGIEVASAYILELSQTLDFETRLVVLQSYKARLLGNPVSSAVRQAGVIDAVLCIIGTEEKDGPCLPQDDLRDNILSILFEAEHDDSRAALSRRRNQKQTSRMPLHLPKHD